MAAYSIMYAHALLCLTCIYRDDVSCCWVSNSKNKLWKSTICGYQGAHLCWAGPHLLSEAKLVRSDTLLTNQVGVHTGHSETLRLSIRCTQRHIHKVRAPTGMAETHWQHTIAKPRGYPRYHTSYKHSKAHLQCHEATSASRIKDVETMAEVGATQNYRQCRGAGSHFGRLSDFRIPWSPDHRHLSPDTTGPYCSGLTAMVRKDCYGAVFFGEGKWMRHAYLRFGHATAWQHFCPDTVSLYLTTFGQMVRRSGHTAQSSMQRTRNSASYMRIRVH